MCNEIWKPVPVPGYEEYYEVSNFGNVRRIKAGMGARAGKILKQYLGFYGYLIIGLTVNNKGKWFNVHRLVATAFIPNLENKPQVNHIDGNKQNNAVSNLEWVTAQENMQHAYRTGLSTMNAETRKKIGEAQKGKHLSEEHRRKIGEARKGHEVSQETRLKIGEAQRRRWQKQGEETV